MNAKDPCPCGSGKRYKHCHGPRDRARRRVVIAAAVAAVAAFVAALTAGPALLARFGHGAHPVAAPDSVHADPGRPVLGETGEGGIVRAPIPDPGAITIRPPNSGEVAPGEHPRRWEYDVAHNRYYDPRPGHMHWHSGEPPADTSFASPAPVVVVTGSGANRTVTTTTTATVKH